MIAADHTARGILEAGGRSMADRGDLLDRLVLALSRPGVNGVLGTPDILEDLLLLGALDGKAVFGSMNRGGLAGATWTLDDRFTAYDAAGDRGVRVRGREDAAAPGPDRRAHGADARGLRARGQRPRRAPAVAMVEPFWNDTSPEGAMRAISIASALGTTSAYTWLKVPIVEDMERVMAATTLPVADPRRRRAGGVRAVGARALAARRAGPGGRALAAVPVRRRRGERGRHRRGPDGGDGMRSDA